MQVLKRVVGNSGAKKVGRLIFGLILIGVLLYYVNWRDTLRILTSIDVVLAALALAILPLNMWISTWKWLILLKAHDLRLPWKMLLRIYWIGGFFSNYLPTNIGGDIVRVVLLHRLGRSAQVAASVILERVTGFLVLLLLAAVGLAVRPEYFNPSGSRLILWVIVIGGIATLALLGFLPEKLERLLDILYSNRFLPVRSAVSRIKKVNAAIDFYRARKIDVLSAIILSVPFYGFITLFQYFMLLSLKAEVALWQVALIAPLVNVVGLIPLSINGLGVIEAAFVLFYTNAGVPPETALAAALLRRVFSLLVSLVGGVFWATMPPDARADLVGMRSP